MAKIRPEDINLVIRKVVICADKGDKQRVVFLNDKIVNAVLKTAMFCSSLAMRFFILYDLEKVLMLITSSQYSRKDSSLATVECHQFVASRVEHVPVTVGSR